MGCGGFYSTSDLDAALQSAASTNHMEETATALYAGLVELALAQNLRAVLLSFVAEDACPSVLLLMLAQFPLMAVYCWVRQIASLSAAMFAANLCLWGSLLVLPRVSCAALRAGA